MQIQEPHVRKKPPLSLLIPFILIPALIFGDALSVLKDPDHGWEILYYNTHLHFGFLFCMVIAAPALIKAMIKEYRFGRDPAEKENLSRRDTIRRFVSGILFLLVMFSDDIYMDIYTRAVDAKLFARIETVEVNHQPLANADKFVADLRVMNTSYKRHQSTYPTTPFDVLLKTGDGDLHLLLYRDSAKPDVYWVFYPHTGIDNFIGSDIAYVTTPVLDGLP